MYVRIVLTDCDLRFANSTQLLRRKWKKEKLKHLNEMKMRKIGRKLFAKELCLKKHSLKNNKSRHEKYDLTV